MSNILSPKFPKKQIKPKQLSETEFDESEEERSIYMIKENNRLFEMQHKFDESTDF